MHRRGTKGEKRRLLDCVNSNKDHLLEGQMRAVVVGWRFGKEVYEELVIIICDSLIMESNGSVALLVD